MKRIVLFLLMFSFISLLLCGCTFKQTFSSENNEYIVSAMGLDATEKCVKICLEAIVVNTEDADADIKTTLLEGEGSSVEEAFSSAQKKAFQPLQMSHIGVVVIGESVTPDLFSQIIKFCHSGKGITLSTRFITCKNGKDLLSRDTISSVAVGYEVMSALRHQEGIKGINYKNCFYEIETLKEKPQNIIALPFFEKTEEGFYISGLKIFENYSEIIQLNEEESLIYAIITDAQSKGEFLLQGEKIKINSSYSSWDISENDTLNLTLKVKLKLGKNAEKERKTIKKGIENLYSSSKNQGKDIFGIENIVFIKKNRIWQKINKDYKNYYKNSTLSVEFI